MPKARELRAFLWILFQTIPENSTYPLIQSYLFKEVEVKGILSAKNGMNIYRGCTHGCIYCDSRSKCYRMNHDFEDVEVKINAPKVLEDLLRRKRKKCMIGTGAMSDPYIHLDLLYKLNLQEF